MLHGHGNDKYKYNREMVADFSSNVWYHQMPEQFYRHLRNSLGKLADYPDPDAGGLKTALAVKYGLQAGQVLVTNGSVEAIYMIAQAFTGKSSTIIYPSFSEYEDACQRYRHNFSFTENKGKWHQQEFKADLVWFGNPNNPDAKTIGIFDVEEMLKTNPQTIFVIDEVYGELCGGFVSSNALLKNYKNLIILKSFTKAFAIPGIRLGYILSSKKIIEKLSVFCIPWSVNSMAIEAGKYILGNFQSCLPDLENLTKETKWFQAKLSEVEGIKVHSSNCNYFLVEFPCKVSSLLKEKLVNEFGILIRDASNFRGLDERFIRLSLQEKSKCELLNYSLASCLNQDIRK